MRSWRYFLLVVIGLSLSACQSIISGYQGQPIVTPDLRPTETVAAPDKVVVETLQASVLKTIPVRISVTIEGYLPSDCTSVERIDWKLEEDTFEIQVITAKDSLVSCQANRQPFTESISIDTEDLEDGLYWVRAGDHRVSFILDKEEAASGTGGG